MASEAKHTPGPWSVEKIGSIVPWTDALSIAATDERGCHIHLAHTTRGFEGSYDANGHHDETSCAWANARLIAAAPELLKALLLVQRGLKSGHIPDQSIIPPIDPDATELEPIPLSRIINAALTKATA